MKWFEVLRLIGPELIGFGSDLLALHQRDVSKAKAEIRDRREEIAARRAINDAALRKKYKT